MPNVRRISALLCTAIIGLGLATTALAAGGGSSQNKKANDDAWVEFRAIFDAIEHPNCVNCHAVQQTNYTPRGDGTYGLPDGHLAFAPFETVEDEEAACAGCHDATLVEYREVFPDLLPIKWHAAPTSMDFRERPRVVASTATLCAQARNPGSVAEDTLDHLLNDPLVLWSIGNGPRALMGDLLKTKPGPLGGSGIYDVVTWFELVTAWVEAGTPCPRLDKEPSPLIPFEKTGDLLVMDEESQNIMRVSDKGDVSVETSSADMDAIVGQPVDLSDGSITVAPDGTIYVMIDKSGINALLRKSAGGSLELLADNTDLPPNDVEIESIAIGSDNALYLLDSGEDKVIRLNVSTLRMTTVSDLTELAVLLDAPGFFFDQLIAGDDITFWLETSFSGSAGVIARAEPFASHGQEIGVVVADNSLSPVLRNFVSGMTRAANGDLLVLQGADPAGIVRVTRTGEVTTFVEAAAFEDCSANPVFADGFVLDDKERVYFVGQEDVAPDFPEQIYRLDATGCSVVASAAAFQEVTGVLPDLEESQTIAFMPAGF